MGLLGAKAIFVAGSLSLAVLAAGTRYLGVMMLAMAGMAYVDGSVVGKFVGHGEWNHWGYATGLLVYGLVLVGAVDR